MKRELIILIPGLVRVSRLAQLAAFVEGLKAASERMPLEEVDDKTVPRGARRLQGVRDGEEVAIDVQEAYWRDLVPSLTQETLKTKLVRGLSLVSYWFTWPVWKGALRRKYLTLGLVISTIAFVAWYLGTLVLFVEALGENPPQAIAGAMPALQSAVGYLGGWKLWAVATAVAGVLPVAVLVDISDFAKRYLAGERVPGGRSALRYEIGGLVRDQVLSAIETGDYSTVTVVGHSFGSVVAVDVMADLPWSGPSLRIVTMGSLVELLSKQASWLERDVMSLADRPELEEWIDVTSESDWFASGAGQPECARCREKTIPSFGSFIDKVAARIHTQYFDHQDAVNVVLRTDRRADPRQVSTA